MQGYISLEFTGVTQSLHRCAKNRDLARGRKAGEERADEGNPEYQENPQKMEIVGLEILLLGMVSLNFC